MRSLSARRAPCSRALAAASLALVLARSEPSAAQDRTGDAAAAGERQPEGEIVIDDPDLDDTARERGPERPSVGAPADDPEPADAGAGSRTRAQTLRFEPRVSAEQRIAIDLGWDPAEDVGELRTVATLEARWAPDDALAFAVGARGTHVGWLERRGGSAHAARWGLEVEPWDTFIDLGRGALRARLGWQALAWGRMDVLPAADVVGRYDLRAAASLEPATSRLPVLAAVLHWDPTARTSFSLAWQPFFEPHRFDVIGGDGALLAALGGSAVEPLRETLDALIAPAWQARAGDVLARAQSPAPDLRAPQVAARATLRARGGELALTAATALEHLPDARPSPGLLAALAGLEDAAASLLIDELRAGLSPLAMRYPRYWQLAADGALDAGPFVLSFEVGWSPARTLYYGRRGVVAFPETARVGLAQLAARLEWPHDESLFAEIEGFTVAPSRDAPDGGRWLALAHGRALHGVMAGGRWAPGDGDWTLEGLALLLDAGPSFAASATLAWRFVEGGSLEVGITWVEGPTGTRLSSGTIDPTTLTPGGLFDEQDQAWLRVRFAR